MTPPVKEPLRILAPNPSALTGPGTTTFLLGHSQVAVIDPGPDDATHIDAVARAGRDRISHILITHAHRDHSAGAARLARLTGAPVLAFGDARAGRSPIMARLAGQGLTGGEGLDHDFSPDRLLRDAEVIALGEVEMTAWHMPGHAAGHLCFQYDDRVFCGDLVMGWSSTLISPPDGDLGDYLRSLERLSALSPRLLIPTHGPAIKDPLPRLSELARHRRARTAQILSALRDAPDTATGLARRIYSVPAPLLAAAARNVLAHLITLSQIGVIDFMGDLTFETVFSST